MAKKVKRQARKSEFETAAMDVYKYASIAVNQIICIGGDTICQPCQNREKLAIALKKFEKSLAR